MILIQQKYETHNELRSWELEQARDLNKKSNLFKDIIDVSSKDNSKLTYQDLFNVSKGLNDIIVLANTDISFDNSLNLVANILDNNMIIALSRWNNNSCPSMEGTVDKLTCSLFSHSQDAWIFRSDTLSAFNKNFILGIASCENRLLYEAYCSGVKIINPALDIIVRHHHSSLNTNYPSKYIGRFLFPKLTNINYSTEALVEANGQRYRVNTDTSHFQKLKIII